MTIKRKKRDEDSVDRDTIVKDRGRRVLCLRLETEKRDKKKKGRENNEREGSEGG